jgi:hypothetical protein
MEVLKRTLSRAGYPTVGIYVRAGEPPNTRLVHRMVIAAFVGAAPTPTHTDIRHLNGLHADARLFNLEWGTRAQNMADVWEHRKQGVVSLAPTADAKWYGGATSDSRLLRVGMCFYAEGKLNITDLAGLWDCPPDVAASIVHGETKRDVPPELVVERKSRRSRARREAIMALTAQGLGFKDINERLNETLTAQDAYYYRSRLPKT